MNNWISVKDRMPKEGMDVLLYHDDGICSAWWGADQNGYHKMWRSMTETDLVAMYWMPLPKPPMVITKEVEDE